MPLDFLMQNGMIQDQAGTYGLALHTTTPELGMAMDNGDGDRHQRVLELGRSMAGELHLHLANFFRPRQWSDLQFIAAAKGPGGFTGARMGLVVARTLAQQLEIPLFAVSTLASIAVQQWQHHDVPRERAIALSMRAQRGQCFTAVYRCSADSFIPEALLPDQVMSPEAWQATLTDGIPGAPDPLCITVADSIADSVGSLLTMAQAQYKRGDRPHWSEASPFYGQHPVTLPPSKK